MLASVIQIEKFARYQVASSGEFLDHHTSGYPPRIFPRQPYASTAPPMETQIAAMTKAER